MKEKTKKSGVFAALAVVLLISAVLITSCADILLSTDDLTPSGEKEPSGFVPPETPEPSESMGYIKLNLSYLDEGSRTILPDTSGITGLGSFTNFDIQIIKSDTTLADESKANVLLTSFPNTIAVTPATYTVRVLGKVGSIALAAGEDSVTVNPTTGGSVNIALKEIVDGKGTGKFTWSLAAAATTPATTATMNIIPLSTGATPATPINITSQLGGPPAALDLNSGYYRVEIEQSRVGHKTVKTLAALHIYQGFTSTFNSYTLPNLKPNVYDVTFAYNDGRVAPPITFTISVNHGATVTKPSPDPTSSTGVFDAWHTNAAGTSAFNFSTPIINPITLYAKWITAADLIVSLTGVSFSGDIEPDLDISATYVSQAGADIEVELLNAGSYDTWVWYIDGYPVATYNNNPIFEFTTTAITANKVLGFYTVVVEAKKNGSAATYTAEVEFEVRLP